MGNLVIGYNNQADTAIVSRGSWDSSYPLSRLKDYRVPIKARTTDLAASSTQVGFELLNPAYIGMVGLMGSNASATASYRVTLYDDFTFANLLYDSGVRRVYPEGTMAFGSVPWGSPSWWTAVPVPSEIKRFQNNVLHVLDSKSGYGGAMFGQFGIIEIFDTDNTSGFFEAGRLFIGATFQPIVNADYGSISVALTSRSTITRARDGTPYLQAERPDIAMPFALKELVQDEAMKVLDLQAVSDIYGEAMVVENPDDIRYAFRRQVFGRLKQLDPITYANFAHYSTAFQVEGNT